MPILFFILVCIMIGVPCYLFGYAVGMPRRTKNIGNLYILKEDETPYCYLALNDVKMLDSLHENEIITLIVKEDSQI